MSTGQKDIYFITDFTGLPQYGHRGARSGAAGQGFPGTPLDYAQVYFAGAGQLRETGIAAVWKGFMRADESADCGNFRTVDIPGQQKSVRITH
jgi:hypothetical protein